jgi:hypothetical protein
MTSAWARLDEASQVGAAGAPDEPAGALHFVVEMLRRARGLRSARTTKEVLEAAADIASALLGYGTYVVAVQHPDGNLHLSAAAAQGCPGALPGHSMVSPSAYQQLRAASTPLEGVFWLPPGHLRLMGRGEHLDGPQPLPADLALLGNQGLVWAPVKGEGDSHAGGPFSFSAQQAPGGLWHAKKPCCSLCWPSWLA